MCSFPYGTNGYYPRYCRKCLLALNVQYIILYSFRSHNNSTTRSQRIFFSKERSLFHALIMHIAHVELFLTSKSFVGLGSPKKILIFKILDSVCWCILSDSLTIVKKPKTCNHSRKEERKNPWPSESYLYACFSCFVLLTLNRNAITLIRTKISLVRHGKCYTALLSSHLPFCVHANKKKKKKQKRSSKVGR